jgi:Na+-transporting NADH:ubiquinone oxidoreductase subunit C
MNKESNSYTLIYSGIIVVVIAVMLSVSAEVLRPMIDRNEAIDKFRHILTSINVASTYSEAEQLFEKYITDSYLINSQGEKVSPNRPSDTPLAVSLPQEFAKPLEEQRYPVFEALIGGNKKYIVAAHGTGMWGPIWGFISLEEDRNTIYGVSFDHSAETPGLGAEIHTPEFEGKFVGKRFFNAENVFTSIAVVKSGRVVIGQDYVDGISGGTITSQAVSDMLKSSIGAYEAFLRKKQ